MFQLKFFKLNFLMLFMSVLLVSMITSSLVGISKFTYGAYVKAPQAPNGPTVEDDRLRVEKVVDGLNAPTSMAFLGPNDILVTEKETGKVMRVLDGQLQDEPALDVNVATSIERGLLGIAISKQTDGKIYVFTSYTESGNNEDGSDVTGKIDPAGNRLYRYEYVNGHLENPLLLLDLPAIPDNGRGEHNGGKIRIGPDNNIYYVIGEVGGHRTQAQNTANGPEPNGLGGVLRITQDGQIVDDPIFGDSLPLSLYYAMGIRNSFGIDFDPVTGNLWDTENGPFTGDEINLVYPGFNSGWALIQGPSYDDLLGNGAGPDELVMFGKSSYSEPKLTWITPIGITALKFMNSDKMGKEYQNDMFVGDINNGLLYRFILNNARDDLSATNTNSTDTNPLSDKEINDPRENHPLVFGQGFGGITDIEVGPDGYLYVLSYTGTLFKIVPSTNNMTADESLGNNSQENISAQENGDDQNPTPPNGSNSVIIMGLKGDKSYSPNPITVERGQTITWYNGDTISHTVTSGHDNEGDSGQAFDSKAIIPNQYYSLTFDNSGTYPYYCFYHPSMVGEIIVN
jgi:glucose/arabinose dehydrogenase/plastocyanin